MSAPKRRAAGLLAAINGALAAAGQDRIKQQASSDEAMAAALGERLQAAQTDAGTRAQRLEEAEQAGKQAEARLAELTDKAESLRNSLGGYAMKLDSRRARLGEAEEKNKALSLKISEKAQRAAALEELERHMEGFARSVKVIMKRRSEGMLDGIHGPVSRLMTVPAKYAVAVETALGAAAQNIVVSDEEAAKAAIRYLKETDSGRATFLPMTSVRGRRLEARGAESCAGYIGTASELIGCDEKYGEIMRSLLGRTVVAQDLDSAVTMAKRFGYSFRVVTLDGQLVNAGGSLTGGSMSRTAGLLSRAGEIQELRAACGGLREKYAQAEADAKKLREEVASLEASVSGINGELATVQEDIIRAEGERRQSAAQAQTLRDDVAALARENETARIRLAELGKAAEEARQKTAELEKAQAQAQKELEELGVSRAQIENKRSEQAERFTRLRLDSLACGKDAENVRREIDDMTAAGSDRQSRIDAVAQQLAQLAAEGSQLADEAAALRQKAADLRQEAERRVGDAKAETEKNQDEEKESVARHAKERSLSEDKEKLSGELARLEERRAAAQTDYDGLISRLWEEYGLTRSEAEKISPASAEPAAAQRRLNSVKKEIKDLGDVNVGAIEEYRAVSERYEFLKNQTEDVEKSKFELMSLIGTLTEKMRSIFTEKFSQIDKNFSETFIELFGGGSARLELTQPDDVLTSGIEITVQPPGKIIKSLAALSGGEQAFVAIALYFAILKVRPSPFCVLDEIEAALDDANVSRFAAYLRRMCADTQFIVITHRRGTMDEADVLYGVTMQDEGVSKLLTLNVGELADKLGIRA
jgi:chromosome segregation protein